MSLCVVTGGKVLTLAVTAFTLSWTHSVEKTGWQEDWQLAGQGLQLREARVKGSGAGMDPGEDAVLKDGWWVWQPDLPVQTELRLAASGATGAGWTLCHAGGCEELGVAAGEGIVIKVCD